MLHTTRAITVQSFDWKCALPKHDVWIVHGAFQEMGVAAFNFFVETTEGDRVMKISGAFPDCVEPGDLSSKYKDAYSKKQDDRIFVVEDQQYVRVPVQSWTPLFPADRIFTHVEVARFNRWCKQYPRLAWALSNFDSPWGEDVKTRVDYTRMAVNEDEQFLGLWLIADALEHAKREGLQLTPREAWEKYGRVTSWRT